MNTKYISQGLVPWTSGPRYRMTFVTKVHEGLIFSKPDQLQEITNQFTKHTITNRQLQTNNLQTYEVGFLLTKKCVIQVVS